MVEGNNLKRKGVTNMIESKTDVIVVGGGPTGIAAATAAAHSGADTLLIERYGFLGGMISAGYVNWLCGSHNQHGEQIVKGVFQDIFDKLVKLGASDGKVITGIKSFSRVPFDPELFKYAALDLVEEAGVNLLLHSFVSDAIVEDNVIKGITVHNKSGTQILRADVIVDATGDADIAASAGAPYEKAKEGQMQALTLQPRVGNVDIDKFDKWRAETPHHPDFPQLEPLLTKEPTIRGAGYIGFTYSPNQKKRREVIVNTMAILKDASNAKELTEAEVEARKLILPLIKFLKEEVPGFENSYLIDTAPQIGTRESRRIVGEYTLTVDDIKQGRRFKDVIGRCSSPMDFHKPDGLLIIWLESDYDIPYRCLVPQKIDNLLVGGRCVSVEHEALASIRVMIPCMATGQAAGAAAALAVKDKVPPRKLDVSKLQKALLDQGVILYDNQLVKTPNVILTERSFSQKPLYLHRA